MTETLSRDSARRLLLRMAQLRHQAKESCCVVTKVHGNTSVKIAVLTVRVNGRVGAVSASHWHASSGIMMKKA